MQSFGDEENGVRWWGHVDGLPVSILAEFPRRVGYRRSNRSIFLDKVREHLFL